MTKEGPFSFKQDDVLIVDASDKAVGFGETSAAVLGMLLKRGVRLYSHTGLHAKTVIIDSVLIASSANLSESSISKLFEAGIETDNPNSVSGAVGMIESLIAKSVIVDTDFIDRIKNIVVLKAGNAPKSSGRLIVKGYRDPTTWLVGIHDIEEPRNPEELGRIEVGYSRAKEFLSSAKSLSAWIRFSPKDRAAEARQGDNLVLIHRPSLAAPPKLVYSHAPVLFVQTEPKCKRIYYQESTGAERKALSWAKFKKLAKVAGLPTNISKNTSRRLSDKLSTRLNDEWDAVR